jgi:polyhydroxybutyrate depolymerase
VHLPAGYDPSTPTPVVLSYHGLNVSANLHMAVTRFNDVADTEGFIVVYPSGIGTSHNAGVCCGPAQNDDVDDVGFAHAMLDVLESELCVDTGRVYANGLSNGGFMSYRLACEASERFAAIGSVAGVTGMLGCLPSRPIPIVHFHGTDDAIVPYGGNFAISYMSVDNHIESWVERNGCSTSATVTWQQGNVLCERYTGCDDDVLVELCTVEGGGHQWFGGGTIPLLGTNTDDVDASQRLWDLLSPFRLP